MEELAELHRAMPWYAKQIMDRRAWIAGALSVSQKTISKEWKVYSKGIILPVPKVGDRGGKALSVSKRRISDLEGLEATSKSFRRDLWPSRRQRIAEVLSVGFSTGSGTKDRQRKRGPGNAAEFVHTSKYE